MNLLANENFPLTSSRFLIANGHDVVSVGVDFMGITDLEVISLANKQNRTILTFDADYGTLIFKHGLRPVKGVIYLRLYDFSPIEPGEIIHQLVSTPDFNPDNTLTVVNSDGIRQRKY